MAKPDPLHGVTLKALLTDLVDNYGWEELGQRINIKCFTNDPSISSSLKFLRKTAWARTKVEALYVESLDSKRKKEPEHSSEPGYSGKPGPSSAQKSDLKKSDSNSDIWSISRSGCDS
jgi:uncharacterized protein (DUF2132 family)